MSTEFKPLLKEVYSDDKSKKTKNKQVISKLLKRIRNKKLTHKKD